MPVFNNILAGAAGSAGGAAGYEIERSLRFNSADSAHLSRTPTSAGNRKTWTLSFWVKGASKYSDNRPLMTYGTASNADYLDIKFTAAGALQMSTYSSYYINTTALFRDPSAWYHFVIAVDTLQSTPADRVKLYVNGVETTRGGSDPTSGQEFGISNNQLHVLGTYANASGGGLAGSNFYLAEYHFVDGQALAQTDFGEYDDNNVWQPKEYSGTYGTNGFYLDFSDNSSNSNDWTVNNLSADGPGVTTTGNISLNSTNRSFYFKGTSGQSIGVSSGNYVWDSSDGISWTYRGTSSTSVSLTAAYIYISGTTDITFTNSSSASVKYWDLALGTGIANTSGTTATFNLEAYGAEGIDSLIDTPTNYEAGSGNNGGNYATLNPLHQLATATLANGNLQTTSSDPAFSTFLLKSGKWYCEHTVTATGYNLCFSQIDHPSGATPSSSNSKSIGWYVNGSTYWGPDYAVNSSASYVIGDVLGAGIDMDNSTIKLYKNGSLVNTIDFRTGTYHRFTDGMYISQFNGTGHFNFGQRPFAYTPPTGYVSLCTTNLDDPLIEDGSTAMNVSLYNGNSGNNPITGLGFSPDLVWLKNRAVGFPAIANTLVGPNYFLRTNGADAENGPGFNNDIVSFDSDGFTLGADTYYAFCNQSSNSYVAWAWDAGDDANPTSISAGGLNSSFYNQDQVWSTYGTFTGDNVGSYDWAGVFAASNTYDAAGSLYLNSGTGKWTLTSPLACNAEVKFYVNGNTSLTINEGLSDEVTATSTGAATFHYLTIPFSGNIYNIKLNNDAVYVIRIYVDGRPLIDQGITLGGAGVPNVPTIASTVRANPSTGFSITNAAVDSGLTGGPTVAHGLNKKPEFILGKNRDSAIYWRAYHKDLSNEHYMDFGTAIAPTTEANSSAVWGDHHSLNSQAFQIGAGTPASMWIPSGTNDCIFFAWTGIEGYSKFGSYFANALDDGPFVFTGFRPRWLMIKHATGSTTTYSNWLIVDTERDTYNVSDAGLFGNWGHAEGTRGDGSGSAGPWVDLLSNGFKIRYSWPEVNGISGDKYIYAAFAEHPFALNGGLAR
jgi:hypothetical protein